MKKETVLMILESLMAETTRRFSDNEKALKIRNWTIKLENITDEQGMEGLSKCLDSPMEFMPSVGSFKELCIVDNGCGSLEEQASIAWSSVHQNLNSYVCPVFKDDCIAETIVKMGGWKNLCLMLETEAPFKKREFVSLYPVMKRQGVKFGHMLTGTFGDKKFIGFNSKEEIEQMLIELENKEDSDNNFLKIISEGIK